MAERVLLVDFENLQGVDLKKLEGQIKAAKSKKKTKE